MLSARRPQPCTVPTRPDLAQSGVVDRTFEVRRLRKNLLTLVLTSRALIHAGSSSTIDNLAASDGWPEEKLVIVPVRGFGESFHIVTAPIGVWRRNFERLLDLKHKAAERNERVVLVPPSFIQREPRLGNARMVAEAFQISITGEDRMAVLIHLLENGGFSNFHDCAMSVVNNESPFSCVLSMAGMGLVDIDLGKPITPHTRVDLPGGR
jgi:hypothetical protein